MRHAISPRFATRTFIGGGPILVPGTRLREPARASRPRFTAAAERRPHDAFLHDQRGLRLSRKAARPSWPSGETRTRAIVRMVYSIASSRERESPSRTISL